MFMRWLSSLEKVAVARTPQEKEAIYRLRYDVYVRELGKGFLHDVDHAREQVRDEGDEHPGTLLLYTGTPERPTGTVRLERWRPGQVPAHVRSRFCLDRFPDIDHETVVETSRLVVRPTMRGKLVVPSLARAGFEACAAHGVRLVFAYCAPGLVACYRKLGYRPYAGDLITNEDGLRIPLVGVTSDGAFLDRIDSPVRGLAANYFGPGKAPPLDMSRLAHLLGDGAPSVRCSARSVRREIDAAATCDTPSSPSLLQGISEDGLRLLARKGLVLDVPAGSRMMREGLREKELFVVLEGVFESYSASGAYELQRPGQVFGEVALFLESGQRISTVRSLTRGKVLVLRHRFIDEVLEQRSRGAVRLLFNLTRIVAARCERLGSAAPTDVAAPPVVA